MSARPGTTTRGLGWALGLGLLGCRVTSPPQGGEELISVAAAPPFDPTGEVDPFIGTAAHGHTFPGATVPFGMVQLSPDTRLGGWDGCSGYHYDDSVVHGFSHTHLSGTGIPDYADVMLVPTVIGPRADLPDPEHPFAMRFDHADEAAGPGWYRLRLRDPSVEVALTATPRVGLHRYRYSVPPDSEAGLVLDLRHRDEVIEAWVEQVSPTELVGLRRSSAWARDQRVYFAARLSRAMGPITSLGDAQELREGGRTRWEGKDVRLLLEPELGDEPLVVAVALSPVDVDGARANLRAEAPHDDFDAYLAQARERWREALARVEIEGGTPAQRRTFYTALYHSMLAPNLYEDVDGRTRGMDGEIHATPGHTAYTVFSLWDTFRATHPLLTILEPERSADFVRTLLHQFRTGGRLAMWELAANYTGTMIGYHAVSVIADAWAKGIGDLDAEEALVAALESADADRLGLPGYRMQGYVPAEQEHESVSKTLEYAYDDWCIARLAQAQGRDELRDRFDRRAQSWANLFDPGSGLFRARENGNWVPDFDPRRVDLHYTEANAWQYGFFVPHDLGGLVEAHGGPAALERRLDQLFREPSELRGREQVDITGLIGQYAHGNEPSHHVAYLYPYVGRAPKTQARVHQIMDTLYSDAPDGLSGNDDCGQLSSWYVLGALGFYPLAPGRDDYVIGTPLFPRATLHLAGGHDFVIEAPGVSSEAFYVQSATLDGEDHPSARLRHADLVAGGRLVLQMGERPAPQWGAIEPEPALARGPSPALPAPRIVAPSSSFGESMVVELRAPGDPVIRYSLDGSEPGPSSPAYAGAIELRETSTVRAAVLEGERRGPVVAATFHRRAPGITASLAHPPNPSYHAGGGVGLTDGRRGTEHWRTGGWLGFQGVDFEATLELDRPRSVHRVSAGFLQDARSWIWMPRELEVEVSADGEHWRRLGRATHDVPDTDVEHTYLRELSVQGRASEVRFVRVRAPTYGTIPPWHPGAGAPTFVFVDEVTVE
ncbi:MAG: GH92 family glycosyl hydrolase [Myxococcales bacterium]|nr:GH92 family glycosyl hydrolase [Myxococcales bacterium]